MQDRTFDELREALGAQQGEGFEEKLKNMLNQKVDDPDWADEMKKRLDKADYGFFSYRTVPSIEHLAVQQFNHNNGKQSFSDSDANLIIVGTEL